MTFDEKQELAQHFIKCYLAAREGLKKLGILRSERALQSDYAEWLTAELLNLQLASSLVHKTWDASDADGKTYQIKSRRVKNLNQPTSFDLKTIDDPFDYLVCVFFSDVFEPLMVIRVPYDVVRELGTPTKGSFRFRWNKRVRKDRRIEIVWSQERPHR